jgi:hypothetical protein
MIRLLAVTVLALSTKLAFAQGNVPGDRVYALHSAAQGSCPSLNWHIVLRPDGVISGTFGSDNPKMVAMVAGSIDPQVQVDRYANPQASNQQDRTFSMIATELGTAIASPISPEASIQAAGLARTSRAALAWLARISKCRCLSLLLPVDACRLPVSSVADRCWLQPPLWATW